MNFDNYFDNNTDYSLSNMFFNETPPRIVKQNVPENFTEPVVNTAPTTQQKIDNEKLFLYFIIIILISSIIIMVRDYNAQFMELTRKVVKVI